MCSLVKWGDAESNNDPGADNGLGTLKGDGNCMYTTNLEWISCSQIAMERICGVMPTLV